MFKDREDPCAVYVILKNKLHECILKDFHLHNGISLANRLYHALPDHYLNARNYVDEVRKLLSAKVGDHTFTRKMGMNVCSMLLGLEHQRKFDCLMARVDDSPALKEPFDREIRGKMVSYQKQTLDGLDKFQQLGALSKKTTDLLGMYTSNKLPMPSNTRIPRDGRSDRKRRSAPIQTNQSAASRPKTSRTSAPKPAVAHKNAKLQPETQSRRATTARKNPQGEVENESRSTRPKGEPKAKISKVNKKDLQAFFHLAVSCRP